MKKSITFVSLVIISLLVPVNLFAWGQKGHRIIAEVAYRNISSATRNKIDKILGKNGMIYAANWPDEIKSDTIYKYMHQGHFQDLAGGMSDSAVVAALTDYPKVGGYLFEYTDSIYALLRKEPSNHDALVFLIHLAGDRYCPMHLGHLDDLGGNKVRMKWHGQNTNLHAVWDSKLIESRGYSYSEYAQMIVDTYGQERKSIWAKSEEEMLLHTYHFTQDIYAYQATFDGDTYHYIYHFHEPMEHQLYIAGVRLAKWLEDLY